MRTGSPRWWLSVAAAFQTLRANPLHTVLSTLGMIVGVGSLVAILSLGDGMEAFAREQIETTTDLLTINVQTRTTERLGDVMVRRTDVPVLTPRDAASLQAHLGTAGRVALHGSAGVEMRVDGDDTRTGVLVRGTLVDAAKIGNLPFVAGRFFSDAEVDANANVAVLDKRLAARLSTAPAGEIGRPAPSGAIGRKVQLGTATFEIIGVIDVARGPAVAYVPITALGATSPTAAERTPSLTVIAGRVEDVPSLRARLEAWLNDQFAARSSLFTVVTNESRVEQTRRAILLFKLIMGAITGISIVVGGIGVMNVLLVSIVQRTREIGIRKAAGARRRDIAVQFLTESIAISGFGSVLGVLFGLAGVFTFAPIVRNLTEAQFHPAVTAISLSVALLVALIVGIVFGTYPAVRAARLEPVEAMRHE
jgi:putative ABC transport system permease protein